MDKKYLAKIIAKDNQGLKVISACCYEAKIQINELKYLKKSQIFLIFLQRFLREDEKNIKKINSVLRFDFIEMVKSKNIDQNNKDLTLELLAINLLKNKEKFEINIIFKNSSCITLSTEIIEVILEDQNKI
tara:strand:+ start:124 stop:516 length:393 start_codon:yes stop_codon:yes gene_type:complete